MLKFTNGFSIGYTTNTVAKTNVELIFKSLQGSSSITIVCGANGSGKTTLFRTISNLISPVSGDIFWNDSPFTHIINSHQFNYFPDLLTFFNEMNSSEIFKTLCLEPAKAIKFASELSLDIEKPYQLLSKGNRQKTALCLAMERSTHATVSIFDEPFTGLDIETRNKAMAILAVIFDSSQSKRLLVSLHTEKLPLHWSDSTLSIDQGLINLSGPCADIYEARHLNTNQ